MSVQCSSSAEKRIDLRTIQWIRDIIKIMQNCERLKRSGAVVHGKAPYGLRLYAIHPFFPNLVAVTFFFLPRGGLGAAGGIA